MPVETTATGRPVRVVIVGDHPAVREHLLDLVGAAGLDVVATAVGVASGYDAVRRTRPEIAVIDNRLPDGRGVELCEVLAREIPETALIVHCGVVTAEETERARAAGVRAVVPKSLRGSELLQALDAAVRVCRPCSRRLAGPREMGTNDPVDGVGAAEG
ncbi:response regulator [Actinomycetospora chiangmaiensis]|uniref:response regulator n=1 Tax=Actinomycetospora chiangmaiensis TaxID=402650 RepID=UPI00035CE70B|nr:response regulator transcription factor [Actinomycetospora chiangmaiensis]